MTTTPTRPALRTIRTTVPTLTLARLAYLAAEAGITIPQLVQAIVIDAVAGGARPACLEGVAVEGKPDLDIKMPGDYVADDGRSVADIDDLL